MRQSSSWEKDLNALERPKPLPREQNDKSVYEAVPEEADERGHLEANS